MNERMNKNEATAICIVVENLPVPADRRVWSEACALRDAGYTVSVICPKGKKTWWAFAAELYLVLKVFSRTRFRMLQGCNPPDNIFLLGLLLKVFGVRYIFDHHDLSPEVFEAKFGKKNGVLSAFLRLAEKCSFGVADVSIATNESFREVAIKRGGMRQDQVFVVRNCPDLKKLRRVAVRPDLKRGKALLVVYVGFMGRQDGLDLLLESIEYIVKHEKRQDAHFVLIGGGTMLPGLREIAAQKELDAFVTFTGQVPHEEVVNYLSNSDVGVASDPKTPMNDQSTMIKIFEYMAFGLPIVLFDLKEGRNVAGPAALYASPNDPVDFANQVIKLLDSGELRKQLGTCGRKRVEDGLNWEIEKTNLIRAYQAALQGN